MSKQGGTWFMTEQKILRKIEETRQCYLHEALVARERLIKNVKDGFTGQQIERDLVFITDMESRAYCLLLLLEEINEEDE